MISRRLLRIKVLHILYAHFKSDNQTITMSEKELLFSIQKSYDLYHYLLLLLLDVARYSESRIELAKQKRVPTREDLDPNTRFIDNKVIKQLQECSRLSSYVQNRKLSWVNNPELIKKLYQEIIDSEDYQAYMNDEKNSYKADKEYFIKVFENHIVTSALLYQILEEQSIYWNDDVEFIISMIIKTVGKFKNRAEEEVELMDLYKNEEDKGFAKTLFRKSVINFNDHNELIDKFTKNWELERIAFMDILIMKQAITEMVEFAAIPVKVSLNEYIEISKFYSTKKSSNFINGVLDKVVTSLKEQNKINKMGRGLI